MSFDVLIRGAEVFPGDGPELRADVGIAGDRLAAVEPSLPADGAAGSRGRGAARSRRARAAPDWIGEIWWMR